MHPSHGARGPPRHKAGHSAAVSAYSLPRPRRKVQRCQWNGNVVHGAARSGCGAAGRTVMCDVSTSVRGHVGDDRDAVSACTKDPSRRKAAIITSETVPLLAGFRGCGAPEDTQLRAPVREPRCLRR
jgi:hypothetical protein